MTITTASMTPKTRARTKLTPVAKAPIRKRRPAIRGPVVIDPDVQHGWMDGGAVVFVGLSGNAHRRWMILDADQWEMVAALWGASWTLLPGKGGYAYVASGRAAVTNPANVKGPHPSALLARLLCNATKDQIVCFDNSNTLDLRDINLKLLSREEARRWGPGLDTWVEHLEATA